MRDIRIRYYERSDRAGIRQVEQWLPEPWAVADHAAFLAEADHATVVAEGGGHVVGFVCVAVLPRQLIVERLAVDPDRRRSGIGRTLLDVVCRKYLSGQRTRAQTVLNEYAVDLQVFLRACGWQCTKSIPWEGTLELLFERRL